MVQLGQKTTQAVTTPISFTYRSGQRSMLPRELRMGQVEKTRTFKPLQYVYDYVDTTVTIKDGDKKVKKQTVAKKRKFLVKSSGNGFFHRPDSFVSLVPKSPYDTKVGESPRVHTVEMHKKDGAGNTVFTKKQKFDDWGNKLRSKAQYKGIVKTDQYYKKPSTLPSIAACRNAEKRRQGRKKARLHRSEGRANVCKLMAALFLNVDIHSFRVGVPDKTDNKLFHYTTNESLAAQSGLSTKAVQRTLATLKSAGIIEMKRQYEKNDDGSYSGRASAIWLTRTFMKASGLLFAFNHASERITAKGKKLESRGVKSAEQIQSEATDQLCQQASGLIGGSELKSQMRELNSFLDGGSDDAPPFIH